MWDLDYRIPSMYLCKFLTSFVHVYDVYFFSFFFLVGFLFSSLCRLILTNSYGLNEQRTCIQNRFEKLIGVLMTGVDIIWNCCFVDIDSMKWMKDPTESNKNHSVEYHRDIAFKNAPDSVLFIYRYVHSTWILINITMSFAISNYWLCECLHATNRTTKTHTLAYVHTFTFIWHTWTIRNGSIY